MDLITMEKKNLQRPVTLSNKSGFDLKTSDNFSKKYGVNQFLRKRESEKLDKKSTPNRNGRPSQRNVRPREKMGGQVAYIENGSEIGSLQKSGRRKQNLSIDIQNWYPSKQSSMRYQNGTRNVCKRLSFNANYTKEHYMQANCQFVVIAGNDYSSYENNPDNLVDWNFIEEVRLHMTEPPACPICLYPPVVARITRCGHIYCFSCALHYLALSDKKWRKCPICDHVIAIEDLKSVKPIVHKNWKCGEKIELKLMRRDRDSLIPVPVLNYSPSKYLPSLSDPESAYSYTKLIVASAEEVAEHIIAAELYDLQFKLSTDREEPEACFIEAALALVSDRRSKLLKSEVSISDHKESNSLDISKPSVVSIAENSFTDDHKDNYTPDDLLNFGAMSLASCGAFSSENDSVLDLTDQISDLSCTSSKGAVGGPKSTYYFYQESGGSHIYLNSLNIHMLTKEYGSLESCPPILMAEILEKESESMTKSLRQKMRCLGHLPISCPFEVVEIDLDYPVISLLTKAEFGGQLEQRERNRRKRVREEKRIERRVQVEEDKLMGRNTRSYKHSTSFKHFPNFVSEETPPPVGNVEEEKGASEGDSSTFTSPVDEVVENSSSVSFAQIIRDGTKQSFNQTRSCSSLKLIKKESGAWPSICVTDSDDESGEAVPDFSKSFSADFDLCFNVPKKSSSTLSTNQRSKKGKKKKKERVLLSIG